MSFAGMLPHREEAPKGARNKGEGVLVFKIDFRLKQASFSIL